MKTASKAAWAYGLGSEASYLGNLSGATNGSLPSLLPAGTAATEGEGLAGSAMPSVIDSMRSSMKGVVGGAEGVAPGSFENGGKSSLPVPLDSSATAADGA